MSRLVPMKHLRFSKVVVLFLTLAWVLSSQAKEDALYQVSYYSSQKNGDFIQELLADWGAVDLGPTKYYFPALGGRYFYFQIDADVVEDLFSDLSEKGDIYVERSKSTRKVPEDKIHFVLWFFPSRGEPDEKSQFQWAKGSSRASKRREQITTKFSSFGIAPKASQKWKNTFFYETNPSQFFKTLASGELLNGVLLLESSSEVKPDGNSQNNLTVRDIRSQEGEIIEESTPQEPAPDGVDMEFRLLPALPMTDEEREDFKKFVGEVSSNQTDYSSNSEKGLDADVNSLKLTTYLHRVARYGLIRMTGLNEKLASKTQIRVRVVWQDEDEVIAKSLDIIEMTKDSLQLQDKDPNEIDLLVSANRGSSGNFVSAFDVTARRWIRRFGLRANYVETAGASVVDYSQLLGLHLQYRFHWKRAKYGQSIIPGLVYKQIRSSSTLGTFLGAGIAYTDDMWKPAAWFFDLVPFFRRPKTVEANLEVLPMTTNSTITSPMAVVASLKGFVNRTAKFKLIGAMYYHGYSFTAKKFTDGVHTSTDTITNNIIALEFGVGYMF